MIYADFLRQDEAAESELLRALQLNPAYVPALLNLANLYEDLGRSDEARALYERLLGRGSALSRGARALRQPAPGAAAG